MNDDDQIVSDQADDKKHEEADRASSAFDDSGSALTSASEESLDIDEARKAFGESNDDDGAQIVTAKED